MLTRLCHCSLMSPQGTATSAGRSIRARTMPPTLTTFVTGGRVHSRFVSMPESEKMLLLCGAAMMVMMMVIQALTCRACRAGRLCALLAILGVHPKTENERALCHWTSRGQVVHCAGLALGRRMLQATCSRSQGQLTDSSHGQEKTEWNPARGACALQADVPRHSQQARGA